MKLSDRIRPDVEAAPWVIEAVRELERMSLPMYHSVLADNEQLRQRVAELEAVLRECRVALLHAYVNCPIVPKINEVLNVKE